MKSYKKLREDFEYLESLIPLDDHVSIMDNMDEFMQNPTKKYAAGLYLSSIELWFVQERSKWISDPKVESMIKRYAFIYYEPRA